MCGELMRRVGVQVTNCGSSPRVRGTLQPVCTPLASERIIPACAGNSALYCASRCISPDHPRVCGELEVKPVIEPPQCGSSPRVRGTLDPLMRHLVELRIIPACAGNSTHSAPRAGVARGSSPRVRGTRKALVRAHRGRRIIPACAGNSRHSPRAQSGQPDHPRVCGEL